jgi:hypothetical protein
MSVNDSPNLYRRAYDGSTRIVSAKLGRFSPTVAVVGHDTVRADAVEARVLHYFREDDL